MKAIVKSIAMGLLIFAVGTSVHAKTLKIATLAPAGTTWMKEMKAGASAVRNKTEGRVKIKFYPGGVMGNDQSVHRKIKIGQLHGGAFTPGGLAHINSVIQGLSLPMMFETLEEVDYVRQRVDPVIKRQMEDSGFVILGISEGGFAQILSKQPMRNLEEVRNSKVWVPEGDMVSQIVFNALGVSPISLPIADVFTGLQTGLIETVTVNPTTAIAFQWHTSTDFMTETPITYLIGILAVQKKAFDKLDPADQAIVREEMGKVFKRMDMLNRDDNRAAKSALQNQGIEMIQPSQGERRRWKEFAEQAIREMVSSGAISADIVSLIRQSLQEFRASQ